MPPATRTALVTGGNRGLGLETCRQLARLGLRVLLTARDEETGRKAVHTLAHQGLMATYHPLDVVDAHSIERLARGLQARGERLDALVNNAAIALDGFNADVARRTIDTNFFAPLHLTRALLPLIHDGGHVVMVSSSLGELACMAPRLRDRFLDPSATIDGVCDLMRTFIDDVATGRHASNGWPSSAYRVSKVGLNALVRLLAVELAPHDIRVNAVCPGWVRTDMGGPSAPRSVEVGGASIVGIAAPAQGPTGGFWRDGERLGW